jgi:hypothetical protein
VRNTQCTRLTGLSFPRQGLPRHSRDTSGGKSIESTTHDRAGHFTELREAIDTLRSHYIPNPSAFTWTDPTLIPGSTPVKRAHVLDRRSALAEVYQSREVATHVYGHHRGGANAHNGGIPERATGGGAQSGVARGFRGEARDSVN